MAEVYTPIADGDTDPESIIDSTLMTALNKNLIAAFEGATGAPRAERGAIKPGVLHKWFFDYGDGSDGALTWSGTTSKSPGIYQATTFSLSLGAVITLAKAGPLIIAAQNSIDIYGTLNCDGAGAQGNVSGAGPGNNGLFGGSGGGSTDATKPGGDTFLTAGGVLGAGSAQSTPTKKLLLATMGVAFNRQGTLVGAEDFRGEAYVGGGAGGSIGVGGGGPGGPLIAMMAPIITIHPTGIITANGIVGGASDGSGGGGAIINATPAGGYTNNGSVTANGGGGPRPGGAGWVQHVTL